METLSKELRETTDKFNKVKTNLRITDSFSGSTSKYVRVHKPQPLSYLHNVMASDLSSFSRNCGQQNYFDAAKLESVQEMPCKQDARPSRREVSRTPVEGLAGDFYTAKSDSSPPFEFSRFLLELSGETCAAAVDVARMIDARALPSDRATRSYNDSLEAVRGLRM